MIMKLLIFACLAVAAFGHIFDEEDSKIVKSAFRRTCVNNGAEDKAPQAEAAVDAVVECLKAQIDPDVIKNEIEAAKPLGTVVEVYKKYCGRKTALKACVHGLYDGIYPCLSPDVRSHLESDKNATEHFFDYICHNDGERLASFVAEGGLDCLDEKETQIRPCIDDTLKDVDVTQEIENLSITTFCKGIRQFTSCTVTAMKGCSSPIPSTMIESLFGYIKRSTPCKDHSI